MKHTESRAGVGAGTQRFYRYNIVSQDDLKEAAIQRRQFAEKQAEQLHNSYNPSKMKKGL